MAERRSRIFDNRILTGNQEEVAHHVHSVCGVDFTVKLLRACVWMPRRKQAKKDAASCEKPRGVASKP